MKQVLYRIRTVADSTNVHRWQEMEVESENFVMHELET